MQLNEGSLRPGDLHGLVHHIFEIDSYKSKMGDDKDVVVLSFTVTDVEPAKDLVSFIEKGYQFVLDADMTPGELSDGKYRVFVELQRDKHVPEQIYDMLYGMSKITNIDNFKFRYYKSFDSKEATVELLREVIPTTPADYEAQKEVSQMESYQHFFAKSMLEHIQMKDNVLEFKRSFGQPVRMKYLASGITSQVLENVEDRIAVGYSDMAEVMFLTKYIGNYNITKMGNKFMFENNGHAVLLEKL